jgi:hypothetical protein
LEPNNHRWLVLRNVDVFPPPFHTLVICERDMTLEVIEGHRERRNQFVIDQHNGRTWGRVGTGAYTKWSHCPPVGMARSPLKLPPPNKIVVVYVALAQYFGLRIGKMNFEGVWTIYGDVINDWITIPVGYIGGWLDLPDVAK